ncbi:MAG: hypothetical protein EOO41_01865 [Methanobacteriota archaeon]|nr:MAG: hypothetical protein EOO41_01865 [Euryarchaeota archaeon]
MKERLGAVRSAHAKGSGVATPADKAWQLLQVSRARRAALLVAVHTTHRVHCRAVPALARGVCGTMRPRCVCNVQMVLGRVELKGSVPSLHDDVATTLAHEVRAGGGRPAHTLV